MSGDGLLARGRAALRAGDATLAEDCLRQAATAGETGAVVEGLAQAAYLALRHVEATELWERSYTLFRSEGDNVSAVRVARTVACMHGTVLGDWALAGGWIARAQTLLGAEDVSSERGWVALNLGMFEPDRDAKEQRYQEAIEVARAEGDVGLELVTKAFRGANFVHADRVEEGMRCLDEALAGVAGGDVDDFFLLEEIFCQLFSACERAHDVKRADQWIRVGEAIAERRALPAISAFCRTHYGGVLTAAGRWQEADTALTGAVVLWGESHRLGQRMAAMARLADLRVRQGRIDEAAQLLAEFDRSDPEAARPLAALHLANGETALACDVIERALEQIDPGSSAAAPLLALLVDVRLAARQHDDAERAAARLEAHAARHASPYLAAVAALARGQVCVATSSGDPRPSLRAALAGFAQAQTPMELARSRLELATALAAEQPEVALAEARAALDAFDRLQAARHVDAAAALLRTLGVKVNPSRRTDGLLTKREAEVLELLGLGLSNPEIAQRLFLSRKTVEHHVGNVLAKLGLRSRAEAAAHAARAGSGKPGRE